METLIEQLSYRNVATVGKEVVEWEIHILGENGIKKFGTELYLNRKVNLGHLQTRDSMNTPFWVSVEFRLVGE